MITDEELLEAMEAGLSAASANFEEDGFAMSAILLIDEDGERYVTLYNPAPHEVDALRKAIAGAIARLRIVAAVLAGEAWYRKVTNEEMLAGPQYGSLADDPGAGEMIFSVAFRAGSDRFFSNTRCIIRNDDGTSTLSGPVLDDHGSGTMGSWLRDLLEEYWS